MSWANWNAVFRTMSSDAAIKRVYGFVAERLMNVYIEFLRKTENIKIKELPLLFWEEDEKEWRKYKNKMLKRKILTALGLGKKKWKVQDA